ncbi:metallopeptidase TldD-related protein [Ideonella sp. BN130291]|uniref:metallopeptidase TldD-related protein n=1 Tax=Ideonella sp. BN130291 TaxID=3112940 RepID=UPI002E25DFAC|nr:metallopeptidase TldD-related protein [Ideonella sp. BN130291]
MSLQNIAEQALACMREQGFEHAQVSASRTVMDELNVNHNEPSLMRSTEMQRLSLLGIVDGRMASTELADLAPDAMRAAVAGLFADAGSAPQDAANAVSSGQAVRIEQGPQQADVPLLAAKVGELLEFRARETPKMMVDEASARHTLLRSHTLTTGGSDLSCSLGWYAIDLFGTARDGKQSSSFNETGGFTDQLADRHAVEHFGIGEMLRDTEQQIHTQPLGGRFTGDVVLTPNAVSALLGWLLGQLGDTQLIAGSSLYRHSVGQAIASPLLHLRSRFDAPGVAAISADAFAAAPVELLRAGQLMTLTPSLYGSRKTGLPHVPVASAGWDLDAGSTPRSELVAGVARGALVGRLSMGNPAANGDFSGVIKNSFAIVDGQVGPALSEVMISGNMAQMLRDVVAVSRERIDTGSVRLPWLRIGNLHFS